MPILASNFTSNSLQGTVKVSAGFANINLGVDAFAFEGNKTFVIKLRKDSYNGIVLGTTSTMTIYDYSAIVSLAANVSTVNEGNLVGFTLTTANVPNYTNVFYSILPATANITASDFVGNTGMITIINNVGTFALKANADLSLMDESGETFKLQVRTNSPVGNIVYVSSNVIIADVSKGYNILSFVESGTSTAEGGTLTLTFNATNVPVGTVFNWSTNGNATSGTFTGGNTGSFVMNSTSNTITLLPVGVPYGTTQNFNVVVTNYGYNNVSSVVATSNNLIVVDSAIAYMSASGGTVIDSNGYRTHAFTTSNSLVVSATGVLNTIDYLVVAGGGGGGGGYSPYSYAGGGGGGAGGLLTGQTAITSTGTSPVTVGGGGAGLKTNGTAGGSGSNSTLAISGGSTLTATGGGGGGAVGNGLSGGSGGGTSSSAGAAGPGTPGQGYPGGINSPVTYGGVPNPSMAGGGGGAGEQGHWNPSDPAGSPPTSTIAGGNGLSISWAPPAYGTPGPAPGRYFAGGGGGGGSPTGTAYLLGGGSGGGGAGGSNSGYPTSAAGQGTLSNPTAPESGANALINTGGGGGGVGNSGLSSAPPGTSGIGGSGIVLIRYPYVAPPVVNSVTTTANLFASGSNIIVTVNTTNANGLVLYYSTNGNVDTTNFIGGNTGSFIANSTGNVFTLQSNTNIANISQFNIQIRQDSTTGFISNSSSNIVIIPNSQFYTQATGGNVSIIGGYKIHTFNASGTLNITNVSVITPNIEYLIVAGGGAGSSSGYTGSGGGGAGGILRGNISVAANTYTITVGGGGTGSTGKGSNGANTLVYFPNILLAVGGGAGGSAGASPSFPNVDTGNPGGSGGGGGALSGGSPATSYATNGNGVPGQGFAGGSVLQSNAFNGVGGGGGGAGGAGNPGATGTPGGAGGPGISSFITGANVAYGGGGGGSPYPGPSSSSGGYGGGGPGGYGGGSSGGAGTVYTGGGGGGGSSGGGSGGNGGSGVVIIRYPFA